MEKYAGHLASTISFIPVTAVVSRAFVHGRLGLIWRYFEKARLRVCLPDL
jgi:hypothetical protein